MADNTIQHVGVWDSRCNDGSFVGEREVIFADEWDKENSPPSTVNGGIGVLAWLIHCELRDNRDNRLFGSKDWMPYPERLTQREAEVAATVIQWLGTSCGFSFLTKCLQRMGYKLVKEAENGR